MFVVVVNGERYKIIPMISGCRGVSWYSRY